jgi:choline dehydrogenase-like flavoprotein
MSRRGAKTGVLDPDLKVKGVEGLRVADAGSIVSANPLAFEKALAQILSS